MPWLSWNKDKMHFSFSNYFYFSFSFWFWGKTWPEFVLDGICKNQTTLVLCVWGLCTRAASTSVHVENAFVNVHWNMRCNGMLFLCFHRVIDDLQRGWWPEKRCMLTNQNQEPRPAPINTNTSLKLKSEQTLHTLNTPGGNWKQSWKENRCKINKELFQWCSV